MLHMVLQVHVGKYTASHTYVQTDFGAATAAATAYQPYLTQHALYTVQKFSCQTKQQTAQADARRRMRSLQGLPQRTLDKRLCSSVNANTMSLQHMCICKWNMCYSRGHAVQ
eukprot:jgi/Chrzof1/9673/Cz04g11230.t1